MNKSSAIGILQDALQAPNGLLLLTNNPISAVNALTRARAERPDLAGLEFRQVSFPDGNLAVTHVGASGGRASPKANLSAPHLPGLEDL